MAVTSMPVDPWRGPTSTAPGITTHLTVLEAQKAKSMTKHEANALHELGMTEEQLKQRQRDLDSKLGIPPLSPAQLDAASDELAANRVPATAEGRPELFRALDNMPAPREQTKESPFAPKTRKRRSDAGLRRPCAGPPTPPEPTPALTITEVPAPETITLTFHLPAGESFGLLQYFAQSGRADEAAYIARQIALFHAAL